MRTFKRSIFTLVIFVILISCGKSDKQADQSQNSSKPKFLSIGTAPPGGAFFVVGSAIAQVVGDHPENSAWEISAEATKGTQENIRRLDSGDLDFALANAAISYFAVRGEGKWHHEYPIRSVMTLAPNIALFITKKSSKIKAITDLRGKRVTVGPEGAGFEYFIEPILKAHDLTYDDFKPIYATQNTAVDLLGDGSANATFLGGAVPTPSIVRAATTHDLHFIPFDQNAKDQLFQNYPFFMPAKIPAETYKNQDQDFNGMNVGSMQIITSVNIDDEIVYQFTKTLYEHREKVVEKHPAGKAINPKNIVKDTGTPFHRGAIRYFKEIGIWSSG